MEKAKGKMKEAAGGLTGDEDKKAEGWTEQRKAAAEKETAKKAKADRAEPTGRRKKRGRRRGSETSSVVRTRGCWAVS